VKKNSYLRHTLTFSHFHTHTQLTSITCPPHKTHHHKQLAQPPPELISSLEALCDDPANLVFVVSGRRKDDLQVPSVFSCIQCTAVWWPPGQGG